MTLYTSSSKQKSNIEYAQHSILAMNTELNMVICGQNSDLCTFIFECVSSLVKKYELILSRYDSTSELYRLNLKAVKHPVFVSEILWNAIVSGIDSYNRTGGYFDISMGNIYHGHKSGNIFKKEIHPELINQLELNLNNRTIFFADENISLDFGGIGKGIVLKEIANLLDNHNIENAFVSFGGSSILTRGKHPHGNNWPFTLQSNTTKVWELNNDSISVSSTHLQFQSRDLEHIINPYILHTVKEIKTAVVKTSDPILAEVLSTTLISAPLSLHSKITTAFHQAEYQLI